MSHRDPDASRPYRRARRYLGSALGIVVAVALAACGATDDDTDDTSSGSSPTGPATTSTLAAETSPSTEVAPSTEATTAPPSPPSAPTEHAATARDAVNELKAAWEAGDEARAARVAPGDVVTALFGVPSEGFEVYGCDTGEFPTSSCNYRNRSTGVFIKVTAARSDAGWQIATITVA